MSDLRDEPEPTPLENLLQDPGFAKWWTRYIDDTAPEIEHKATTYGSNSLKQVGMLIPRAKDRRYTSTAEALEMGCFIYAYGKMERVADAILRGELPNEDSWHDLMVYAAMALYIRETGAWP